MIGYMLGWLQRAQADSGGEQGKVLTSIFTPTPVHLRHAFPAYPSPVQLRESVEDQLHRARQHEAELHAELQVRRGA
jgi:hypothetical protein